MHQASCLIVLVSLSLPGSGGASAYGADASPLPLTVQLKGGKRLQGQLDPRTDADELWLRFGGDRLVVTRRVPWEDIETIDRGSQRMTSDAVRQLAGRPEPPAADDTPHRRSPREWTFGPRDPEANAVDRQDLRTPRSGPEWIHGIHFDAELANWDGDVETDGLVVELWGWGEGGQRVAVQGILHAELWALRRVEQDSAPRSRGRVVDRVGQWSIPVRVADATGPAAWVRLPFEAHHPEFDTGWAPGGLLHLTLVVPGQGVFQHAQDGLRIRPFAPLRDHLERQGYSRFLPSEPTARK